MSVSIAVKRRTSATTESNVAYIYDSVSPIMSTAHALGSNDASGRINYITKAVLTKEMNRAGQLTIEVPKYMLDLYSRKTAHSEFIEVKSPYLLEGSVSLGENVNQVWRGVVSSETIKDNVVSIVWDGELTLLDRRPLEPYDTVNAQTSGDYFEYLINKFNTAQDAYSPPSTAPSINAYFGSLCNYYHFDAIVPSNLDAGVASRRSSSNTTTFWKEISDKLLNKYDNQLSVLHTDSTVGGWLYYRKFSTDPLGSISLNDMYDISATQNVTNQVSIALGYGAHQGTGYPENDAGKISVQTDWASIDSDHLIPIGSSAVSIIHTDDTTTTSLRGNVRSILKGNFLNGFGLQVKIRPDIAKTLWLGEVYNIEDPNTGTAIKYRLTQRSVDLFNPANNTYTFGRADIAFSKQQTGASSGGSGSDITNNAVFPEYGNRISLSMGSNVTLYRNNCYRLGNFLAMNLVLQIKANISNGATLFTIPNTNIQATQELMLVSGNDRTVYMAAPRPGGNVNANSDIPGTSSGIYYFVNGIIYAPEATS